MSQKLTYKGLANKVEKLEKKVLEQESILDQLGPIFTFSLDMIGSGNLKGYFTKVNPSFKRILGYPDEEFMQFPFLDFVHPDDFQTTKNALEAAVNGQQEISIANRYRCKDGTHKWIDWHVQAFADKDMFIAVGRDVTEKKTLEKVLYLTEQRYRNIIQTSLDGFLQTDEKGNILDCNSTYLEMSGYNRDELLSMKISGLEALENAAETEKHIKEIIKSGFSLFESAHRRKDGSVFDIEATVTHIPQEKVFVCFVKDISARKALLKKLEENAMRFRQLAENIEEVFWLGSTDWQAVYYISPAYEKIWGKTRESLYINPLGWVDSVVEEDREKVLASIPKNLDAVARTIVFPEYRIRNKSGDIRWIHARGFPIRDSAGKVYRVAGLAEDITKRKIDEIEKHKLVRELQKAMEEIKTLKGFLPVCASCKMIRDEKGKWLDFESYIAEHSEAEITHSICPVCSIKLYPDMFDEDGKFKK